MEPRNTLDFLSMWENLCSKDIAQAVTVLSNAANIRLPVHTWRPYTTTAFVVQIAKKQVMRMRRELLNKSNLNFDAPLDIKPITVYAMLDEMAKSLSFKTDQFVGFGPENLPDLPYLLSAAYLLAVVGERKLELVNFLHQNCTRLIIDRADVVVVQSVAIQESQSLLMNSFGRQRPQLAQSTNRVVIKVPVTEELEHYIGRGNILLAKLADDRQKMKLRQVAKDVILDGSLKDLTRDLGLLSAVNNLLDKSQSSGSRAWTGIAETHQLELSVAERFLERFHEMSVEQFLGLAIARCSDGQVRQAMIADRGVLRAARENEEARKAEAQRAEAQKAQAQRAAETHPGLLETPGLSFSTPPRFPPENQPIPESNTQPPPFRQPYDNSDVIRPESP